MRAATGVALAGCLTLAAAAPAAAAGTEPDVIAPEISSTGLVDGQLVPAILYFEPVATDDTGVVRVEAVVDNTRATVSCGVGRPFRVRCRAFMSVMPNDVDAVITLRAFDAAGNHSEASTRVHVDNVNPRGGALSPAGGSSVRSGTVRVTLTNVSDDTAKIVMFEHVAGTELATGTAAPWSFTWQASDQSPSPCLRISDAAGNDTTICTDYIVDDEAPIIQRVINRSTYAPLDDVLDTGTGWVGGHSYVYATTDDESPLSRTEWWVDGALSAEGPTFDWDNTRTKKRSANLEIRVWDAAGNSASRSFPVSIDNTGPVGRISPGHRALVRGSSFATSIKGSDPAGIAWSTLGGEDGAALPGFYSTARVWAGRDGLRTVRWTLMDRLANGNDVTRVVIIDNTAPTLKVTKAPKNKAKVTRKVRLTASTSDRNGVARVQMLVNGKVVATDTKAAYSFTLNPKKYGKKFTVQLRAYDRAGNVKSSSKRTYRR